MSEPALPPDIPEVVARALAEDLGSGDLTAALVDADLETSARVTVKEAAVLCGSAWFDEVFRQLDAGTEVQWHYRDGDRLQSGDVVCRLSGRARALLSGERTALNLLQTLSGTATAAEAFAQAVTGTAARILDTRKTLPGLRLAQKYAVRCGGAHNHRIGLFDAVLIKENHVAAVGGIRQAVERARQQAGSVLVEVEVETLEQLREALDTSADRLMLDNFSTRQLRDAVALRDRHEGPRKELEASGNVTIEALRAIAETGVDWISVGAITKNLRAIDFSMLFDRS